MFGEGELKSRDRVSSVDGVNGYNMSSSKHAT